MGRKSTIETLPPDLLAQLQALLLDPRMTQLAVTRRINAALEEAEMPPVSKSAVQRYAQSMEELTAEVAETDRLAALMLRELKITNLSSVGQATAETLRVMLMHFIPLLRKAMSAEELSIKDLRDITGMLKDLSAGHERLENSATINERRQREMESAVYAARLSVLEELSGFISKSFPQYKAMLAEVLQPFARFLTGEAHG